MANNFFVNFWENQLKEKETLKKNRCSKDQKAYFPKIVR